MSTTRVRVVRIFVVTLCLAALGLMATAGRAFAANKLDSTQPQDGSTVASPDKLQFFFTDVTDAKQLKVLLEGPSGAIEVGEPSAIDENSISVALPALAPGDYSASWRLGTTGGLSGAIRFTVSAQATTTTPPTSAAPSETTAGPASTALTATTTTSVAGGGDGDGVVNGTSPAQALARFVAASAALVLVGAYLVLLLAWPAGLDLAVSSRLLRGAAVIAVAVTLLVILMAPDGASDALGSLAGRAMAVRLVLLAIAAVLLFLPGHLDEAGRRDALIGSLAATLVTFPFAGHGARIRLEPLGVVLGVFHVAGVAVFLGGLVVVVAVVLANADGETALVFLRRITRLLGLALGVAVVSGLLDAWRLIGSPSHLFSGWHARLLVMKSVVVAVVVVLWFGLREVIDRGLQRLAALGGRMRGRLSRAATIEVLAGLFAILLTAFAVGYRPAAAGRGPTKVTTSTATVELAGTRFGATITLEPGAAGANRLRVKITGDTTAVTGFKLRLLPVDAAVSGIEADLPVPKNSAVVSVDNVPIPAGGEWRVELSPIGDASGGTLTGTLQIAGGTAASTTAPAATSTTPPNSGSTSTSGG